MSDNQRPIIEIDFWWVGLVILILFYAGEPDLMDAIVHRLMECP